MLCATPPALPLSGLGALPPRKRGGGGDKRGGGDWARGRVFLSLNSIFCTLPAGLPFISKNNGRLGDLLNTVVPLPPKPWDPSASPPKLGSLAWAGGVEEILETEIEYLLPCKEGYCEEHSNLDSTTELNMTPLPRRGAINFHLI